MTNKKPVFIRVDPQLRSNLSMWKAYKGHKDIASVIRDFVPCMKVPSSIEENKNETNKKKGSFFPKI